MKDTVVLKPLQIRDKNLKNRLVMPPMATSKSEDNGLVSDALVEYYDQKSKSGDLGLIILEHMYVNEQGKANPGQGSIAGDETIAGLKKVVDTIHENGPLVMAQISHAGSASKVKGNILKGPSTIENPLHKAGLPQELNISEIDQIVENFASAAKRAREAGFDGVEIHSAHGYLLDQFYSPLTNQRKDEYGGSLQNRIRLHKQIIEAVRNAVGKDMIVALRLGAVDFNPQGATIEDAVEAAKAFEKAGIDLLDISGGMTGYVNPLSQSPGYFSGQSSAIRKAVNIPVILTGGIQEIEDAERLLQQGDADLIGVGRAVLKDSDWPAKAVKKIAQQETGEI